MTGEDAFSLQNEMFKENLLVFDFTWLYEEKCMMYLNELEKKKQPTLGDIQNWIASRKNGKPSLFIQLNFLFIDICSVHKTLVT